MQNELVITMGRMPLSTTLVSSSMRQAYLTDVLTKLVNLWPAARLDELMPWAWGAERSTNKLAA